jgi:hypothetical protein
MLLHDDGAGSVTLDGEGNLMIRVPLSSRSHEMVVIEENVSSALKAALSYAVWVLERIDPTLRLTHSTLAVILAGSDTMVWRTQREQDASPNSYSMGMGQREPEPVHLAPPHRPRAALKHNADQLVEDLLTLVRREWKAR